MHDAPSTPGDVLFHIRAENGTGRSAAAAALIGEGEPEFRNGRYAIVQYLHDLTAWQAVGTEQQERIIGRTKTDDIEIPDEQQADNSHVSPNTIVDGGGVERDILRNNMVFGNAGTGGYGTYYIACAADPAVPEHMLHNMLVANPAGNYDRILDVSTPVTGSLFFVPSLDLLESLAADRTPPPAGSAPGRRPDLIT